MIAVTEQYQPKPDTNDRKGLYCFLAAFLLWVLVGGCLLIHYGDAFLFRYIHIRHTDLLDTFFKYFTLFGTALLIIPVLLCLYWFRYRNNAFLGLLLTTQLGSLLINQGLKFWFARPRPAALYEKEAWFHHIPGETLHYGNSFPSGHTAGAFAFFLLLSLLLRKRHWFWAFAFLICALLVAYSRIYLAQHFFADVYAGSIEGVLVCLIGIYGFRKQHSFFK
ncbi:phosphatase PAP2 family protein [Taibaiella sp. KBW10]|uniref:phosphatase PAP2 family protein n=1 Tax=Taibaiella sp. KBW10 TaxID=2153357 RepID=UPI0013150E9A|nr:phosphatase PAP2 family protein [Taibaiella sp. KBW10]